MASPESTPHPLPADAFPLREADRCVMCGMCLVYCPTYLKSHEEGESPRGRIALLMALARADLTPSAQLHAHLDHCLVCRACERICPANVPYGQIIDAGRTLLVQVDPPSPVARLVRHILLDEVIANPPGLRNLGWLLYLLQRSGLVQLAPLLGLGRLAGLLPALPPPRPFLDHYPAHGPERGRVALFTGCIAEVMDRVTLESALKVLTRLGYRVDIPPRQVCCGALHLHNGAHDAAQRLIQRNLEVFAAPEWEYIITTASGCGSTLMEYPTQEGAVARRVMDISDFLTRLSWPPTLTFRPLDARVALHDPCSLVNVLRQPQAPYTLLRKIPGLTVLPLPGNDQCCGGAGAALLTKSALTQALLLDKINALRTLAPDILVTSNLGCALHLAQGARQAGIALEVIHPVTLLARQIV